MSATRIALAVEITITSTLGVILLPSTLAAQEIDPELLAAIHQIQAVDNHTHVPKVVAGDEKDTEYDALPCSGYVEPSADPFIPRPENPKYLAAWRQLYGYRYQDEEPAHLRELATARNAVMQREGDNYPRWVLDQLHIQYMLANRITMGRGLPAERFLWVPFADPLLVPFAADALADTPDRKVFYQREKQLFDRYLRDSGLTRPPTTLAEYVDRVVVPTLARQKQAGAVAIKFEAAYLRSLDFGRAAPPDAAAIYARFARGGNPARQEYLALQNALIRIIAEQAGKSQLPVHFHTGAGCGSYFHLSGSDPLLLDPLVNDPRLRNTKFVLVHGGAGPFTQQAAFLIGKPNVYLDFSEQDWLMSVRSLAVVLRQYLEAYPEKVLFGTDLFPGPPEYDWDVVGWQMNATGREGLAMALTSMVRDGEITRERALELARMVMRENALKLYRLPGSDAQR